MTQIPTILLAQVIVHRSDPQFAGLSARRVIILSSRWRINPPNPRIQITFHLGWRAAPTFVPNLTGIERSREDVALSHVDGAPRLEFPKMSLLKTAKPRKHKIKVRASIMHIIEGENCLPAE